MIEWYLFNLVNTGERCYFLLVSYRHGNKCAGVIAGVSNNSLCGVGLAYNAKIAGMRQYKSRTDSQSMNK